MFWKELSRVTLVSEVNQAHYYVDYPCLVCSSVIRVVIGFLIESLYSIIVKSRIRLARINLLVT